MPRQRLRIIDVSFPGSINIWVVVMIIIILLGIYIYVTVDVAAAAMHTLQHGKKEGLIPCESLAHRVYIYIKYNNSKCI